MSARATANNGQGDRQGRPYNTKLPIFHVKVYCRGDPGGRPIGINLSWEARHRAGRPVGAREDDEGWCGPLWSPAGWGGGHVSPRYQPEEQDAGDHKGPPFRSPPLSPLRTLLCLLLG